MRVFLSYRRNDTGGRAGRLFDLLVARFGIRNVFQDVDTVAPGLDFITQVEAAIETSDVVLVLIGRNWLGDVDANGRRRIDSPTDFVRQEVAQALAAGLPVVPVLVDDSALPAADELPTELASLVLRQTVTIRDVSWHSDVDDLIRRLEGDHRLATASRWRLPVMAGAGLILALAIPVAIIVRGNGDGSHDDSDAATTADGDDFSRDEPPPCGRPDDSWQPITLIATPFEEGTDYASRSSRASVEEANVRDQGEAKRIVVSMRLDLVTTSPEGEYVFNITASDIEALYVDDQPMGAPSCFSASPRSLEAGESAEMTIGFDGAYQPGSSLVLATNVANIDVTITDP